MVRMLSKSDRVLFQWSDEDTPSAAEVAVLGKPLHVGYLQRFTKCFHEMLISS